MSDLPAKILVVDDELKVHDLVQQFFRRQIRSKAYEFIFANDGKAALERIKSNPDIDLIVTDLRMPHNDGFKLMSELTSLYPAYKVLVISAYYDLDNIRMSMRSGAFDFLPKPINFKDLEVRINEILTRQQEAEADKIVKARRSELADYRKAKFKETLKDASSLPDVSKLKLIRELAADLDPDQLETLLDDLEDRLEVAIAQAERQQSKTVNLKDLYEESCPEQLDLKHSSIDDYRQGLSRKVPNLDIQLKPDEWLEAKYTKHKLSTGEEKVYGPYYVVRGKLPNGKLYTVSLGKLIKNPELIASLKQYEGQKVSSTEIYEELTPSSEAEDFNFVEEDPPELIPELRGDEKVSDSPQVQVSQSQQVRSGISKNRNYGDSGGSIEVYIP